jgi:hypothetical protein
MMKSKMPKRIVLRLLAVVLILSVGCFAMQVAGHWHGHASDEQHCQICHVGHTAVPQPTAQVAKQPPAPIARLASTENQEFHPEPVCDHSIPRAPPA